MNTLSDAVVAFGRALRGQVVTKTRKWYLSMLWSLLGEHGDTAVTDITADDLLDWYAANDDRVEAGEITIHTLHGYVMATHRLFGWLAQEDHISKDVSACLRLPDLPDEMPKAIAAADLQLLLNHTQRVSKRDFAICCFLADTGCRAGGLLSLTLDNLYLDEGRAIVKEKRGKLRSVFFGHVTYGALVAYLAKRTDSNPAVFIGKGGRPLKWAGLNDMLCRQGKRAGCQGRVNAHAFRHAFAREFLRNGGELSVLGRLLGHKPGSPATTKYYAVWAPEELQTFHQHYSPLSSVSVHHD